MSETDARMEALRKQLLDITMIHDLSGEFLVGIVPPGIVPDSSTWRHPLLLGGISGAVISLNGRKASYATIRLLVESVTNMAANSRYFSNDMAHDTVVNIAVEAYQVLCAEISHVHIFQENVCVLVLHNPEALPSAVEVVVLYGDKLLDVGAAIIHPNSLEKILVKDMWRLARERVAIEAKEEEEVVAEESDGDCI
jgi:hypothetical protein